jgi:copper(I)-binding protein
MHVPRRLLKPGLMASRMFTSGLFVLASLAAAQADEMGLHASVAWSRPTVSAAMAGVVYVTITDHGKPTTLVRVSTPIAARAEMHQSLMRNGMMEMAPVRSLAIAPDAPITFSPGGYHIMLTGLTQPLSAGQTFPLTLIFADGGSITTTVTVQPMMAGAPPGAMESTGGMKMSP